MYGLMEPIDKRAKTVPEEDLYWIEVGYRNGKSLGYFRKDLVTEEQKLQAYRIEKAAKKMNKEELPK